MKDFFSKELSDHIQTLAKMETLKDQINEACKLVSSTLKNGNKILICGNGGSAADSQHFAAELVGRYKTERSPLPAIALSTDTSALTAIGNDYGFDFVFERGVRALGQKGDLLVGISTSGNSKNVINAASTAASLGLKSIALLGKDGGVLKELVNHAIIVPSSDTARIQEMHILIIHTICAGIDAAFAE